MKAKRISFGVALVLVLGVTGLHARSVTLEGAGATFPQPLYKVMFQAYEKETGVKVNYEPVGSGEGIRRVLKKEVAFGGTDAYLSDTHLKRLNNNILHIPTCIGAIALAYNLPSIHHIRLTPNLIEKIYLGEISSWDDSAIQEINPKMALPRQKITPIYRADKSGTTFIFTDYLTQVGEKWKYAVGKGKKVDWPRGMQGKGNYGVAGMIGLIPGSIGYVESVFANQKELSVVALQNKSGHFVRPSIKGASRSAQTALPNDLRVLLSNTQSKTGYPISGFSWVILYQNYDQKTSYETVKETVNLLWWMIHDGQKYAAKVGYSPLPREAVRKAERLLKSVRYQGKPVI